MLKNDMSKSEKEVENCVPDRTMGRSELRIRRDWHRYFQKLGMIAGLLTLSFFLQLWIASEQQARIQQGIAKEVLRFHVLANSDSEEDQAVKLQVRDAVLQWMEGASYIENETKMSTNNTKDDLKKEEISGKKDLDRTEILQFLQSHLYEIEAVANQTLAGQHQSYRATAAIQTVYFPERTYGACTFPAGWYEALRIRLGEAKGHNWWCVLYPRLCFTDCLHAVVEEDGQQELKKVLTEEEYETLLHEPKRWKVKLRWLGNF